MKPKSNGRMSSLWIPNEEIDDAMPAELFCEQDEVDINMKLYVSEPHERHAGPILVCDEAHNDIAEFFHSDHATVEQSYATALMLANALVAASLALSRPHGGIDDCDCVGAVIGQHDRSCPLASQESR